MTLDKSWVDYVQNDLSEYEHAKTLKGISFEEAVSKLACVSSDKKFFRAYNKNITMERRGEMIYIYKSGLLKTLEVNDVLAGDWVEK